MENPAEELKEDPTVRPRENPSSDGRSSGLTGLAGLAALLAAQRKKH